LSGYDVARAIRRQAYGRDMLLIAMTGWGQEHDRQQSAASGFDHHLVKPIHIQGLMEMLEQLDPGRGTVTR
jgi:CheY-like chemotaxis protein